MTALPGLQSPIVDERLRAIDEVKDRGRADDAQLHALAACLGHARKIVQRRAAEAFAVLHGRGIAVREVFLDAICSPLPSQRWGAVFAWSLIEVPPAAALPVLLESLGSGDGDVRWAAASILVRMAGTAGLVQALEDRLTTGPPAQRKMAAYCLRDLDVRSVAIEDALFRALADGDPGVRMAAMSSLTRLATDRGAAANRVAELLHDPDEGVRRAAAVVLGILGEPSRLVIAALHAAHASADVSLHRAAERSLRLLKQLPS